MALGRQVRHHRLEVGLGVGDVVPLITLVHSLTFLPHQKNSQATPGGGVRQLGVLYDVPVPPRLARVGGGQQRGADAQLADNARLGDAEYLLLDHLK